MIGALTERLSIIGYGDGNDSGTGGTQRTTQRTPPSVSSCTGYREYPFPEHHTGLPYLADAFASFDSKTVTFVGINRGKCEEEWKTADSFATFKEAEYHRFVCVFHTGNTADNNNDDRVYVLSAFVESTWPHDPIYLIQCQLPQQFRHLIRAGQTTTELHVDVLSMDDMEQDKEGAWGNHRRRGPLSANSNSSGTSAVVDDLPSIPNVPVCHPASAHSTHDRNKNLEPNQFELIGYLPVTSSYALDSRKGNEKSTIWSSVHRIPEWIDYHKRQGFDHFVVYDNDKEPHGPIETILKEHIDSGLVSYRWFPLVNCMSAVEDRRMDTAQIAGSMAALHRIGYATKYLSYHDGDEYFVPLSSGKSNKRKTVARMARGIFESKPSVDAIEWVPTVMAPCNGTTVKAGGSVLRKWKCLTDQHYADVKLIVRTATIFYFCIHYPTVTVTGGKPEVYRFDDKTEGYLAHYRAEDNPTGSWRDNYSGPVRNEW
eukprot:CAMPEP_0168173606 /NCGR_PEP_ID=MMETSP0139_2-20121125/6000_1 /TAXON_ID=44445 /ORGANISM="Pseudo-nitzschia australis, Strain 10249 10 AB" /LENGTH=484 /DNA_ID=CAMNT_0008091581 /DNA_START=284 /DNA_END=1735 /DNA_ORIENTATION=+